MLLNNKSSYYLLTIFSYLDERKKLELIKYNKNFQNKLDINIITYRLYSGRYIIYETKEKGKEYNVENDCYFRFEGEYKIGRRNGKGKEFHLNEVVIEGEYLNGKRNGKGKEYEYNDLKFEGNIKMEKEMEKEKNMNMDF